MRGTTFITTIATGHRPETNRCGNVHPSSGLNVTPAPEPCLALPFCLASGLRCLLYTSTSAITELTIRILFFFLAGVIVNRFAVENRRQTRRYQVLAEELEKTNRRLEQIQAEARRSERLAALGQLSAGLAHEIRNPLGVIKGSAEMLQQKLHDSNPLASELANYISSEVNRLSALVTRFLDFARPQHLETAMHSVADVVERALKAVAAQWTGPAIDVERKLSLIHI